MLALLVVGMGFFWPMLRQFEFGNLFDPSSDVERWMCLGPLAVSLAFIALALVALAARRRVEPVILARPRLTLLLAVAGSAGLLLMSASASLPSTHETLRLVAFLSGAALLAAGYLTLALAFMGALLSLPPSDAVVCLTSSYALSTLAAFSSALPHALACAFTVLSPALAGCACGLASHARAEGYAPGPDAYTWGSLRNPALIPVLLLGLFLVTSRVAIGMFNGTSSAITPTQRVIDVALVAVVALASTLAMRHGDEPWRGRFFRVGWASLAVVAVAGILLLTPIAPGYSDAGLGILGAVLDGFEMFLWVNLTLVTAARSLSVTLVFGASFIIFKMLPVIVGKLMAPAFARSHAGSMGTSEWFAPMAFAMVLLLVAALVAFLTSEIVHGEATADRAGMDVDPRADVLRGFAEELSLTAREAEVLDYLSRGFNYQAVAAALGISAGTAQGYAKGLYRKAGVHSKQQLIEMVEARLPT